MFQRSGSFIVAVAIFTGWYLIHKWMKEKRDNAEAWIKEKSEQIPQWVDGVVGESGGIITKKIIDRLMPVIGQAREGYFGALEEKFVVAELILVVFGTIIWGYGDLLPLLWGAL
jgi:hypothetical protein